MSRLFQVKQSNDEEFDVEGFEEDPDTHSSSPSPPSIFSAVGDDVNNNVKTTDDDDDGSTSFASNRAYFENKKTVIAAFSTVLVIVSVAVSVVVGLPINGAAGHNQEFHNHKSFAAALDGKAAKSSFCEPEPEQVLTCGQTFTDEKVVLSDDLFCTDEVDGAASSKLKSLNAAIKIEGPDAVIDCKGHTISQRSSKNAAFCDDQKIVTRDEREDMKTECDLFYVYGIWLVDGATAINCKVEHFYYGIQITDGGEVKKKKSEVSGNRVGVSIQDNSSSTTKISDLYAHDNYDGIIQSDPADGDLLIIEDVTSKNNIRLGMKVQASDITVKDSVFISNENGIVISGEGDPADPTKVTFEGTVSSHGNIKNGITVNADHPDPGVYYAEVTVKGTLNTYLNGNGILVGEKIDMDFTVSDRGSFNSCENTRKDINNIGNVDVVNDGTITCDSRGGASIADFPDCVDCPACD